MKLDLIEKVTLPLKYKLVLAIGTGIVLFVPSALLQRYLGFQIQGAFKITLGIIFVLFASFSVVEILLKLFQVLGQDLMGLIRSMRTRRTILRHLRGLTNKEKEYLAAFVDHDTITNDLPYNDGITQSLIKKGIIYIASRVSSRYFNFPCNVQPIVWEELKKHPELVRPQKATSK